MTNITNNQNKTDNKITKNALRIEVVYFVVTLLIASLALAFIPKSVTLSIDGAVEETTKKGETVEETLKLNKVDLKNARVSPSLATKMSKVDNIAVKYKRSVTLVVDGESQELETFSTNVAGALHEAKVDISVDETFVSMGLVDKLPKGDSKVVVSNPKALTLKTIDGVNKIYTNAPTVRAVLKEEGLKLDSDDELSHELSAYTKSNLVIELVRITVVETSEHRQDKLKTIVKKDPNLPEGKERVENAGYPSVHKATVKLTYADNELQKKEVVSKTRVSRGEPRVIIKGTKSEYSSSRNGSGCGGWQSLLDKYFGGQAQKACQVMKCESGGNPKAQNPRSTASGLFQFLDGTWKSARSSVKGGERYSRAMHAPAEMQIAAAAKWLKRTSWSQWSCA